MEIRNQTDHFDTELLLNNINYGVILSFVEKFGKILTLKEFIFDNFEYSIVNQNQTTQFLRDFLWSLIRNTSFGKNLKKNKIDLSLGKLAQKIFGNEILFKDFCLLDLESKLELLKNLVELQFDENPRFKQILHENSDDGNCLRFKPIGKNINGSNYWLYVDTNFNIRLFSQYSIDVQGYSWKLITKNIQDIRELVERLQTEPLLEKIYESDYYHQNIKNTPKSSKGQNKLVSKSLNKKSNNLYSDSENLMDDLEDDEESRCSKCTEIKENYLLIICDSCDLRFHVDCLKPQIEEIPDGDWYCPICEHSFLIRNLQDKLKQIEIDKKECDEKLKLKIIRDKENELKKIEIEMEFKQDNLNSVQKSETLVDDKRSRRVKSKKSYTFEDYDRQIKEATGFNIDDSELEEKCSVRSLEDQKNFESQISESENENSEFSSFEIDIKKSYLSYDESESESNDMFKKLQRRKKIFKNKKKIQQSIINFEETDTEPNYGFEKQMRKFRHFGNLFKRVAQHSDDDNEYTAYNEDDYFNQNTNQL